MKKTLKKCSLWVCGILASFCFGGGLAASIVLPSEANATVNAEETTTTSSYTVGSITSESTSTATALHVVPENGDGNTLGGGNWDDVFVFQANSGAGLTLNGEILTTTDFKQPGAFYVGLGTTAEDGDVVVLDGTWASDSKEITFNNSALKFNGSAWETCTAIALGSVTISGSAEAITLTSNETLSSEKTLSCEKGGIYVNGESAYNRVASITTTKNGVVFTMQNGVSQEDVVYIYGLYKDTDDTYYVISEGYYAWTGSEWETLTGYAAIISKATPSETMEQKAQGFYIPIKNNTGITDWAATTLTDGQGLKLNGTPLQDGAIKFYNDAVYVDLGSASAATGDILTIDGSFQHSTGARVLFAPTQALKWNGESWDLLGDYTTYDFDALTVHSNSQEGKESAKNDNLYLARVDGGWLPVQSWDAADVFAYESGANVKKNGDVITYTMKSTDAGLFLGFDSVSEDDVISIGGTFVCEGQSIRYVIKESYFKWNGSYWESGSAYTKTEIEDLSVSETDNNRTGFFINADKNVGLTTWDYVYVHTDGDGFMLNGEEISGAAIKPIGTQVYVDVKNVAVQNGDVLTVSGTFVCEVDSVTSEIVFTKTQALKWNGMTWDLDEKTTYSVGSLVLHGNSYGAGGAAKNNSVLYLSRADGGELLALGWGDENKFVCESGNGFTVDGVQITPTAIKSTGNDGFYWEFDAVSSGSTVTIGGTFVCESQNARYVIEESCFDWNGSVWSNDVTYNETYTIKHLQPVSPSTGNGASATAVYLGPNGSKEVPKESWEDVFYLRKGDGLKVNGVSTAITTMKSTVDGLYLEFAAVEDGSIVTLSGTFVCKTLFTKYVIEESVFEYKDGVWKSLLFYSEDELEYADTVTNVDLGWGLKKSFTGTTDLTGTTYTISEENTTGSIKLRFNYYTTDTTESDVISFRLRGSGAWESSVHIRIIDGGIQYIDKDILFKFESEKTYEIELGAIDVKDSTEVWSYIKVDGVMVGTASIDSATNTNLVSVYVEKIGGEVVLSDPDHVQVTYTYDGGESTEYAEKGAEYQLSTDNASSEAFVGWLTGEVLYQAGETITMGEEDVAYTAFSIDFKLKDGAAIRLADTADESGIRFIATMKTSDLTALKAYVSKLEYGILIMPNDYLADGQSPNLTDFVAGKTVLKIPNSGYTETDEDDVAYTAYYGAMKKLYTQNYNRDFAGRGYMIITFAGGSTKTIYTPFDADDNVRSVKTVATRFMEDTEKYEVLSDKKKAVVQVYAGSGEEASAVSAVASVQESCAAAYVYVNKQYFFV